VCVCVCVCVCVIATMLPDVEVIEIINKIIIVASS